MVDQDKIEAMLHHLYTYTGYLRDLAKLGSEEFLNDPTLIGSARYYLQVSIETCINIANHIIATARLRAPKDYKDTFKVLAEAKILPVDFARTMQALAGLRNLLVHLYWEVDDQMIHESINTELGDFETFTQHIITHLDNSAPND